MTFRILLRAGIKYSISQTVCQVRHCICTIFTTRCHSKHRSLICRYRRILLVLHRHGVGVRGLTVVRKLRHLDAHRVGGRRAGARDVAQSGRGTVAGDGQSRIVHTPNIVEGGIGGASQSSRGRQRGVAGIRTEVRHIGNLHRGQRIDLNSHCRLGRAAIAVAGRHRVFSGRLRRGYHLRRVGGGESRIRAPGVGDVVVAVARGGAGGQRGVVALTDALGTRRDIHSNCFRLFHRDGHRSCLTAAVLHRHDDILGGFRIRKLRAGRDVLRHLQRLCGAIVSHRHIV